MEAFSAAELAGMAATQEAAMQDTCERLAYRADWTDAYGRPAPAWVATGNPLACGFDGKRRREVMAGTQVVVLDAVLRLPLATVLDHRDRIRITYRFGTALAEPETYEIVGEPRRGPSGLLVDLRLVSDGTR